MKWKEPRTIPEGVELPPKKGLLRLFELLEQDGTKFFRSGLLALVGMIPLCVAVAFFVDTGSLLPLVLCIPAGMLAMPQLTAAADTVMRSIRGEVGWWWWNTYKTVWKRNAKASLLPGAIFGVITGLQIYCLFFLLLLENPLVEFVMLMVAIVFSMGVMQFYLPMLVCMDLPFGSLVRNCFVMFMCHPLKALLASVVQVAYFAAILIWFPLTLVIFVLTSLWLPMLLAYSILYPAMDKELNLTEAYKQLQDKRWGTEE